MELAHADCGFITTVIFERWSDAILIPYVLRKREELEYYGSAFLIIDACSTHVSDDFFQMCFDNDIEIIFLPSHSSDQLQPNDLGIFGIQKQGMGRVHPPRWLNPQTQHLVKIMGSYQATATPPNIISAFSQGGIVTNWDPHHRCLIAQVDRSKARKIRGDVQFIAPPNGRIFIESEI